MAQAKPTQDKQTSGASAFRNRPAQNEGELLELTGGNVVRVKRPSITLLVQAGIVPANVAAAALKQESNRPMNDRDVQRLFELKLIIAQHALISPRVVREKTPNYDADEIDIKDLNEDEINDLFAYTQMGLERLTSFREERQRAAARSDLQEIPGDQA